MKSTGRSSGKQLSHKLIYFLIAGASLGLLSSSHFLINMMTGVGQACNPFQACYLNAESYSTIFNSRLIVLPALYFLIILFFVLYFFTTHNKQVGKMLYYLSECAVLIIALFIYLEVYRSAELCLICMIIIASALMVFVSSLYLPKYLK